MDIKALLDADLYITRFPIGINITWRALSYKEFRLLHSLVNSGSLTEDEAKIEAYKLCVVGNNSLATYRAGIILTVGYLILQVSGFPSIETIIPEIESARSLYGQGTIVEIIINTILLAFPAYKYHDLESLSKKELLKLFALAEGKMRFMYGDKYNPVDFNQIFAPRPANAGFEPIAMDLENNSMSEGLNVMALIERNVQEFDRKRMIARAMEGKK